MKGSKTILVLATLAIVMCASTLWAQTDYSISLTNTITPGVTAIKFDGSVYMFKTSNSYGVGFARLDGTHVIVSLKALTKARPCEIILVQWDAFSWQPLDVDGSPGGDVFIFNSETGYAEK